VRHPGHRSTRVERMPVAWAPDYGPPNFRTKMLPSARKDCPETSFPVTVKGIVP